MEVRNIVISIGSDFGVFFAGLAAGMQKVLEVFGNAFTNTAFSNLGFDGDARG